MMLIGKKFRFNNVFLSRKNKVVVHEVAKLDNACYKGIMEKCEKNIPLTLKEFIIIIVVDYISPIFLMGLNIILRNSIN